MTPVQLEVLLHHYYCPQPLSCPSRAQHDAQRYLLGEDLITSRDAGASGAYETTDRGRAYVQALMELPLPTKIWVIDSKRLEVTA